MQALADTSIFIADEHGRELGELPEQLAVSVVTLAELELGVLTAADASRRSQRLRTLTTVRDHFEPLPVDEAVASAFAGLVATLREHKQKLAIQDAWIAATAITNKLPLCTQDTDFDVVTELQVIHV